MSGFQPKDTKHPKGKKTAFKDKTSIKIEIRYENDVTNTAEVTSFHCPIITPN
jgi:hypothetical protein